MRYLITGDFKPFFTQWFQADNHFAQGMTVYDLLIKKFSIDGINWQEINFDHL